jgi:hypothetical protein
VHDGNASVQRVCRTTDERAARFCGSRVTLPRVWRARTDREFVIGCGMATFYWKRT